MSNIVKQEEVSATTTVKSPNSTDEVVSLYEKKISQSIASKILATQIEGKLPIFTSEETAYLRKRSVEADIGSEIEVITADPPITLKKGNKEISIKNAPSLVKRMEKVLSPHPTSDVKGVIQDVISHGQTATNTFVDETSKRPTEEDYGITRRQSVSGRNAYEIRSDVLQMAIDWASRAAIAVPGGDSYRSDDEVIALAKRFYQFVENKRY